MEKVRVACVLLVFALFIQVGSANPPAAGSALAALQLGTNIEVLFEQASREITGNATFEAWISIPDPTSPEYKSICSRYRSQTEFTLDVSEFHSNKYADWNLQIQNTGNFNFFMGGFASEASETNYGIILNGGNILPNSWTHVAFSFTTPSGASTPSHATIFINGTQVDTGAWGIWGADAARQVLHMDHPISVGHYVNPDQQWFPGSIDEIRFWNVYRNDVEIRDTMYTVLNGDEPGLVGYYRLNEGHGSTVDAKDGQGVKSETYSGTTFGPASWKNSGVQRLALGPTFVFEAVDNTLDLLAVDPEQNELFACSCERVIASLPTMGELYYILPGGAADTASGPLTVGSVISDTSKVIYHVTSPVPTEGAADVFSFYASENTTSVTSDPADFILTLVATGTCPEGACTCLDPVTLTYRDFPQDEFVKALIVNDLDFTIRDLDALTIRLDAAVDELVSENNKRDEELTDAKVQELLIQFDEFNRFTLETLCTAIQTVKDSL